MRKFLNLITLLMVMAAPCQAAYRIELLQVADISVFEESYAGIVEELARHGLIEGQNLSINRVIIDAGEDPSLWQKLGILGKIKKETGRIVNAKPDLVITMGTPPTKYGRKKIMDAGIPLVFSSVFNPVAAGSQGMQSTKEAFTGSSNYMDPRNVLEISRLAFPQMQTIGFVHSDDDNAVAFIDEVTAKAAEMGIKVLAQKVDKTESPVPAAQELLAAGADTLGIPVDAYYAIRDFKAARELAALARERRVPTVAFISGALKGSILYVSPDFKYVGALAGRQAAQILKDGKKPADLPILYQENLNIQVDIETAQSLGIELPIQILQLAKAVN